MALQLGPVPNFNVQTPDFTQKAFEGAQLKNMLSETALRQSLAPLQVQEAQQKVQQETMANELQRMQLEGQKSLQKWLQEGDTNEDIPADQFKLNGKIATFVGVDPKDPIMQVVRSMAQHGVPAPMLMAEAQGMLQRRNEYNKGTEEQQKIIKENYDTWKDAMGRIFNADPKDRSLLIAEALPRLQAATHLSPELDSMLNLLRSNPEMGAPIAYNLVAAQDKALALSKAGAEAAEAQTKATEAAARATGAVTPQMKTEQQQKLDVATAEARIHAQVQASMLPLMEQIRQGFANQKDARDKIDSTVLKPYQEAQNNIEMAREMTTQAATNPVAARLAVFKLIGVAQPTGTHRVLPAEVEAAKFPGGLGTRVAEHISDFLNGKPWTPEIQQAVQEVINGQDLASKAALNTGIGNANKLYGTNVGTGLQQSVSQPGGNMIYARDPQGVLHQAARGTPLPKGWKEEKPK